MILSFTNICKVPGVVLKTEAVALGFQHFSRDLANVNEWKIMFDPSIGFVTFMSWMDFSLSWVKHEKRPDHQNLGHFMKTDCAYGYGHILKGKSKQ